MTEDATGVASHRGTITILVLLAAMMQTLDTTIVNVALPYVQGSVATSPDQITWVLTSYITACAIMTPPREFQTEFGIPDEVMHEAFWHSPTSRKIMASYFNDMRALATELGFMNRFTRRLWKQMGIDGEPSRTVSRTVSPPRTTSRDSGS